MFEVVIGLEVHVQLNTKTKLFCSCPTSFNHKQNTNTCPTCLALPGALPVLNKEVLHKSVMLGTAIEATINQTSYFDRKSYFYPDSPSAYQITQLYTPVVEHGKLRIDFEDGSHKTIRINRAHIEADAGKNIHDGAISKVDLNRAGTPLLEIVSEPDMRSAEEAILYLKKLHSIIRYLDIGDANMQEGSFRVDVNVSIRPKGDEKLYTRVEIKNINSFRFIQKAIELEVARQVEAWEDGVYDKEIVQETRLFDQVKQETRSMRGKEEAADYRYFPEPDLLKAVVTDAMMAEFSKIPELPDEKMERFIKDYDMSEYNAMVVTSSVEMAHFFESMMEEGISAKNALTWLTVELQGRFKGDVNITNSPVNAKTMGLLVKRIEDGTISGKAAKEVLDHMMEKGGDVDGAIDKLGLKQVSDTGALEAICDTVIAANGDKVAEYKSGKDKLFGFFVGQVMKESKGSANPQSVNDILKEKLG
ncbi:MAG: Asp-tRNA(Asn)/Glu-tRNA(Gln) amidotransferase subunit GatB [Sulfurimonas sp.]|jgi:aspartyl-tRNA(Asn)/glutamyl-tRNA(Gln) amidotransferase subunit B|uniref:Asp-tRNA(Asn)/Glu-tRNA(Gln) amidotransferase subunit GatB n=1 Tax=unclassified Sulfurimonas TaxID=2623549 RepID=UPI0008AE765C|nr:Asp-tRNA(Asn)/Glu-tRNA(Gln) amidotransferase subunit GatB [Sulfurimonas sp. RIFOXYB12_FULL_35_9]MBS4068523.1 Asp-tRNA(Asn)/Glu-tRNA(Gln) amidotransferase subunit GatB [Sulfurimonas sp.]OHE04198.1 MAG: aspartyl/glutamyl-tRNA amidotransferase subunit B [Sulfurimonas sp. RIFOXYB12_FULL_35_9]OHE15443.1 MAG: aspartyl/glutamyl-tRNA amidotransferase subunit B [Sulfurimonas sp. RIFOXYB2_FULL_37_5]